MPRHRIDWQAIRYCVFTVIMIVLAILAIPEVSSGGEVNMAYAVELKKDCDNCEHDAEVQVYDGAESCGVFCRPCGDALVDAINAVENQRRRMVAGGRGL